MAHSDLCLLVFLPLCSTLSSLACGSRNFLFFNNQHKFISHILLEAGKFMIKVPEDLVSGESLHSGSLSDSLLINRIQEK